MTISGTVKGEHWRLHFTEKQLEIYIALGDILVLLRWYRDQLACPDYDDLEWREVIQDCIDKIELTINTNI